MGKQHTKIAVAVACLLVVTGVTAYINSAGLADKLADYLDATVQLQGADGTKTALTMDTIRELGETVFTAEVRSSSSPNREHEFAGVPLKAVLEKAGVSAAEAEQVLVRSVDGYVVALGAEEVLAEDNVYLVYAQDGEPLGTREDGGSGPYMTIVRQDSFSQRWSKYVLDIELQ